MSLSFCVVYRRLVSVRIFGVQHKMQYKGICLESRYPRYTCSSDFTFPLAVGACGSLQLDPTLDLCTRYPLRLDGPRQCGIPSFPTLLHMASTGNRTPDLLILSPTSYPLGHMLPHWQHTMLFQTNPYNVSYDY